MAWKELHYHCPFTATNSRKDHTTGAIVAKLRRLYSKGIRSATESDGCQPNRTICSPDAKHYRKEPSPLLSMPSEILLRRGRRAREETESLKLRVSVELLATLLRNLCRIYYFKGPQLSGTHEILSLESLRPLCGVRAARADT